MNDALVLIVAVAATAAITVLVVLAVVRSLLRPLRRDESDRVDTTQVLLGQQTDELRDRLDRVGTLVQRLGAQQAHHQGVLAERLSEAQAVTADLARSTQDLNTVLSNPTARGQWGERLVEDVLKKAGFVKGVNYLTQATLPGTNSRPDVTFLLPGDLLLAMDVKFPIDNFLLAQGASGDAKLRAQQAFRRDVKARVKELSSRDYIIDGVTVDHALLFVPNEAVYSAMHEMHPDLGDEALAQRVVLCSPYTLFSVLSVIRTAVDTLALRAQTDEILDCLSGFQTEWGKFTGQMDLVTKRLGSAQDAWDDLVGTRQRQLDRRLEKIDAVRRSRPIEPETASSARLSPVRRTG